MTYEVTYKTNKDWTQGRNPTETVRIQASCIEETYDVMYDEGVQDSDIIRIREVPNV